LSVVHASLPHDVVATLTQPPHAVRVEPSHLVFAQSFASSMSHAGRTPWGLPVAGVHVPSLPFTSQASHCPSQARSQHTPSTQWPEAHSIEAPHVDALFLRHVPTFAPVLAQAAPAPQSATEQQTLVVAPFAQCPDWQATSPAQLSPSGSAPTHVPLLQKKPRAQSPSAAQVDRQALGPHA
jgi:hypothetical protein